jgi:hypothetical protein
MKKIILSIASVMFFTCALKAQNKNKDTVMIDSTQLEKIEKMPMDTIHHKMPVDPVLPEEQKDDHDKEEPITVSPSFYKKD